MQRATLGLLFFPFVLILVLPLSALAIDCSNLPGTRPATASDPAVINGQIPVDTCYNPNDASIGQNDEQAKQFLISRYQNPGPCSQLGLGNPKVDGIEKLSSQFAINLAAMLQAAPMYIGINSAFRTQQAQQCANPKVGGSNHSKGCAVDLGYGQNDCGSAACQWVKANAGQYHLQLRLQYAPEWNHLEPTSCSGTALGSPIERPQSNLPFDQQARQALGMQPSPPPPPQLPPPPTQSSTPAAATQPSTATSQGTTATPPAIGSGINTTPFPAGTCAPQTYCSQQDGNIYYRATTCVDQTYKQCASGCTGIICNTTSNSSGGNSFLSDFFSTSTSNQSSSGSKATSTFDLIDFFAQSSAAQSTAVGTATPIDINQAIQDTSNAEVLGALPQQNTSNAPGAGSISGPSAGLSPQQTFTSGDLSNSPASYNPQQSSTFQQTLSQMKTVLLNMLPYVQPFGGRVSTQTSFAE